MPAIVLRTLGNLACDCAQSYLELSRQALQCSCICLGDLFEAVGEQAVEHAEVGGQAGAYAGNLLLVPRLQDALDCIVQH